MFTVTRYQEEPASTAPPSPPNVRQHVRRPFHSLRRQARLDTEDPQQSPGPAPTNTPGHYQVGMSEDITLVIVTHSLCQSGPRPEAAPDSPARPPPGYCPPPDIRDYHHIPGPPHLSSHRPTRSVLQTKDLFHRDPTLDCSFPHGLTVELPLSRAGHLPRQRSSATPSTSPAPEFGEKKTDL